MKIDTLSSLDWQLLEYLQQDGRIAISVLANKLNRSRSNITERIEKLKDSGILKQHTVKVDEEKLGFGISAFVRIQAGSSQHRKIVNYLSTLAIVAECHVLTGTELVIVRVVAKDMPHLRDIVDDMTRFGETQTDVIFSSVKRELNIDQLLKNSLIR